MNPEVFGHDSHTLTTRPIVSFLILMFCNGLQWNLGYFNNINTNAVIHNLVQQQKLNRSIRNLFDCVIKIVIKSTSRICLELTAYFDVEFKSLSLEFRQQIVSCFFN